MATARLIRMSRSPPSLDASLLQTISTTTRVIRSGFMCMASGFGSENGELIRKVERKPVMAAEAATPVAGDLDSEVIVTSPTQTLKKVDLTILTLLGTMIPHKIKMFMKPRPWSSIIQSLIEKVITDSRFFTTFGVAGTLIGSVLCFLEGVFLVMESYLQYFHALSHHSDHGHIMHLLIEALDMFIVGTAMLTFGMGLHVMFIGSHVAKGNDESSLPSSNFFGLFYLKEFPLWVRMKSISEAKSRMGHALMLLLQVGFLEKFKNIPLVTGLDLACFAATIFVSSAGLFVLSKLSIDIET